MPACKPRPVILTYSLYATGAVFISTGLGSSILLQNAPLVIFCFAIAFIEKAGGFEAGKNAIAHVVREILGVSATLVIPSTETVFLREKPSCKLPVL